MIRAPRLCAVALAAGLPAVTPALSQELLLDRILARVNDQAITLLDVRAAVALGIVDAPSGATRGLIDRQLMLAEVARFSPPEPDPQALARAVSALEGKPGSPAQLEALLQTTGLNRTRLSEMARDTLRIQAYLNQRFGASVIDRVTVDQWVRDLRRRADIRCQIPGC